MGVFSAGTTQTRTNNKWAGYALPANPGYVMFLRHHIYVEGGGTNTIIQRWGWQRITGAVVTAATAEKASTRSPAFAGTAATLEPTVGTVSGNPYYFLGACQERFLTIRHSAYPRPQARPVLYDTEQATVAANAATGLNNVYDSGVVFSDDVPRIPIDHLPRRRGRKAGWFHTYRHGTELGGAGANQIISNARAALVWQVAAPSSIRAQVDATFVLQNTGGGGTAYTDSGTIPVTITMSGAEFLNSVDSGTIPVTIALSGADQAASTDSGTIPVTIALSGADQAASTDSGAIPVTVSLSGADQVASTDAGTIPLTITITGTEQFGPAPTGRPRINEFAYNKDLPPVS